MKPSDDLRDLLRDIPRTAASASFTGETLARVRRHRRRRRLVALTAVAAALAGATYLAVERDGRAGAPAVASRTAREAADREGSPRQARDLRERHRRITAEVRELRRRLAAAEPAVYVGSAGDADLVLDLVSMPTAVGPPPGGVAIRRATTPPLAPPTGSAMIF